MVICPECKNSAEAGAEFCRSCGASLPENIPKVSSSHASEAAKIAEAHLAHPRVPSHPPHRPKSRTLSPAILAAIVGIILVLAAGAFLVFGFPLFAGMQNSSGAAPGSGILPVSGDCSAGMSRCSGTCVNLKTDPANCGSCGFSVPYGETCQNGQFSSAAGKSSGTRSSASATVSGTPVSCPAGRTSCSGTCRNLVSDANNCGSCGNTCPTGQSCRNSQCSLPDTTVPAVSTSVPLTITPELSCSGRQVACGGSCVDIFSDKKNCGVCGRTCKSQEICVDARCGPACTGSETLCGDTCVDLDSDTGNCGACGTECSSRLPNAFGATCTVGKCGFDSCKTDYADCNQKASDGCEVFLRLDANNCGSCGNKCPTGQVCYSKKCSVPVTS